MANKLKQIITPKGEILFPHLTRTETYQGQDTGKYTVTLKFSKEDSDKLIDLLEKEWDAAISKGDLADKKPKRGTAPNLGFREDKNGDIIFKAKTNATIKTKTGATMNKTVPVFDAKRQPITEEVGHGSVGKAALSLNPYFANSTNYGISLYLDGIQVLDLKEPGSFGADAASLGFEEEDGFVSIQDADTLGFGEESDNTEEF